jgi:predicted ATPase
LVTSSELDAISRLSKHAVRTVKVGADRVLVFVCPEEPSQFARLLLDEFSGSYNLLRRMMRMRGADPFSRTLVNVDLVISRSDFGVGNNQTRPPLHLLSWLSDGEQSFVGRMCLPVLTRGKEGLILFDEPEVHFNDIWKRQMVRLLESLVSIQNTQMIVTTHSSITLTDLAKQDIRILLRTGADTSTTALPAMATLGTDPGDIMLGVFSAEFATGSHAVDKLRTSLADRAPEERERHIVDLETLLPEVAPGYWKYRILEKLKELRSSAIQS